MANKKIKINITESEMQDLMNGTTYNWTFDGVEIELTMGDDE